MSDETRVVLIKPGDTLLIGNVGDVGYEQLAAVGDALRAIGFEKGALFFEGDITMGVSSAQEGGFDAGHLEERPHQLAHRSSSEGLEDKDRPRD